MSRWTERLHRRLTLSEAAIWAGALLTVSAACAAAALAAPDWQEPAGQSAPQAAILIELAPEPEAIQTETSRVTEDRQDAAERPSPIEPVPQRLPQPEPLATASLPMPQTLPEPAVDPLEQQMLAALDRVEVPLPLARPAERPKPADKKETAGRPQKKKPRPASEAGRQAAAPVKSANRNAAARTVISSTAAKGDSSRWKARVVAHLERRKRYPSAARARGEQGTVLVAFRIDAGGRVLSASLARSSGHAALDEAALSMVARASPVPAPPSGEGTTLTAPVRFVRR